MQERLDDAEFLWAHNRREGALLSALVAVAATARKTYPSKQDKPCFVDFMKTTHTWTIAVEYRGESVDVDYLFYRWLRCELVHQAALPPDLRIDDGFANPDTCAVRAGGAPEFTVLVSPGWFRFLVDAVRNAPANADINWN